MPRVHLIEIHEQPWCPAVVRDHVTAFVHFLADRIDAYAPLASRIAALLPSARRPRLIDLCAGGGGGMPRFQRHLEREVGAPVPVLMTDLFPNLAALEDARRASGGRLDYVEEPVDARAVPTELEGVRTLFNAFHHFRPADARGILESAVRARDPVAVVEAGEPGWYRAFWVFVCTPALVLLMTPFMRPVSGSRLLLTYLLPVLPLVIAFDAAVSSLRVYGPEELDALTRDLGDYRWEHGRLELRFHVLRYLLGRPREPAGGDGGGEC